MQDHRQAAGSPETGAAPLVGATVSTPPRAALLDAYGAIGAERELRARALGVRLSAILAGYAAALGNGQLLAEALAGLRRAVA